MLDDKKIISTIAKFLVKNLLYSEVRWGKQYIYLNEDLVKLARELGFDTNTDVAYEIIFDFILKYFEEMSMFGITVNEDTSSIYYNGKIVRVPYSDEEFTE